MSTAILIANISNNNIEISIPAVLNWNPKSLAPLEQAILRVPDSILNSVCTLLKPYENRGEIKISFQPSSGNTSPLKAPKFLFTPGFSVQPQKMLVRSGPKAIKRVKIIHLSDLHFPKDQFNNGVDDKEAILSENDKAGYSAYDQFTRHLERHDYSSYDLVYLVITGDLTNQGKEKGLYEARDFIIACAEKLQIPHSQVVVAPGNHDVFRNENTDQQLKDFKKATADFCTPFSEKPYIESKDQLLIYSFNTNRLDCKKATWSDRLFKKKDPFEFKETPLIGTEQLDYLKSSLKELKHQVRIAALHHHLVPVWGIEAKQFDPVLDAGKCINELQEHGFLMVLHGHKHRKSFKFIQSLDIPSASGLYIVGTGSFGFDSTFNELDVTFYDVGPPSIAHISYRLDNGNASQVGSVIDCTPKSITESQEKLVAINAQIKAGK